MGGFAVFGFAPPQLDPARTIGRRCELEKTTRNPVKIIINKTIPVRCLGTGDCRVENAPNWCRRLASFAERRESSSSPLVPLRRRWSLVLPWEVVTMSFQSFNGLSDFRPR